MNCGISEPQVCESQQECRPVLSGISRQITLRVNNEREKV